MNLPELRLELQKNADEGYREFNIRTNPGAINSLGVRVPVLRRLAKEITRSDFRELLGDTDFGRNFEENLIYSIVLATAKMKTPERLEYLRKFIPRIQDWATCDCTAASFKLKPAELSTYWEFLRDYENSSAEFEVRFMLVMMLDYFLIPEYLVEVLDIVNDNTNQTHYAAMAAAWLVAESFTKNYDLTLAFMTSPKNQLSDFVYNKALQKARESYRISDSQKAGLQELKRRAKS